jgi:hypothetical protein
MGTAAGLTETGGWYKRKDGLLFPQRSIFDQITDANLTWANYFQTTPWEVKFFVCIYQTI